jgi:GTP cyclohydrolase I
VRRAPDLDRARRAVAELLDAVGAPVGSDPELDGTPDRVARALAEDLLAGYDADPVQILAERTATRASAVVVVTGIDVATTCPHHLMPAIGVAHVGYAPGASVVGLGALARLVDCFARRLSLQEDLAERVAAALAEHVGARAAVCAVDLAPTCLTARGQARHGARAICVAWAGVERDDPRLRADLLAALPLARAPG